MNKLFLHLEGLAVFVTCLYFYGVHSFSWVCFLVLLFVPDLFMLGYLVNHKVGAVVYNLGHTYTLSLGIVLLGIFTGYSTILAIGIIWTAHIGMDRMIGFGLKYSTAFRDTHLSRV